MPRKDDQTSALDEEESEDEVSDDESEEGAWECLRCDTFNASSSSRSRCGCKDIQPTGEDKDDLESENMFMDYEDFLGDDDSLLSAMTEEDKLDDSSPIPPREMFQFMPNVSRSQLLSVICNNRKTAGEDLTVVQITKQSTASASLRKLFLDVPEILSKNVHEGRIVPSDALFVLLELRGIVSVYNQGQQVGDDNTIWDVYAQNAADGSDSSAINYYVVDTDGENVGQIKISSVYQWYSLLYHLDKDVMLRSHERRVVAAHSMQNQNMTVILPSTCSSASDLPQYLALTLQQMSACSLTDANQVGIYKDRSIGSPGLACKHCNSFKFFPESQEALSTAADEMIVSHIQTCMECPKQIRDKLNAFITAGKYKQARSLRSSNNVDVRSLYFGDLWMRLQAHGWGISESKLVCLESEGDAESELGGVPAAGKRKKHVAPAQSGSSNKRMKKDEKKEEEGEELSSDLPGDSQLDELVVTVLELFIMGFSRTNTKWTNIGDEEWEQIVYMRDMKKLHPGVVSSSRLYRTLPRSLRFFRSDGQLEKKNEVTGPTAATKSHHHEGGKATPSASASPSSKKKGKQKQSVEEEENKEVLSGLGRPRSMSDPNLSVRLDGYGLCHDEDTYLRTYIL